MTRRVRSRIPSVHQSTVFGMATTRRALAGVVAVALGSIGLTLVGGVVTPNGAGASSGWSGPVSVDNGGMKAVSCSSASFCVAVDSSGFALTYDGSSWSLPFLIDSGHALRSVSCLSASFCVAGDDNGHALTYDGSSWSAPVNVDVPNAIQGVSCPRTTWCGAVDSVGREMTYNGSTWSPTLAVDSPNALDAVSCADVVKCGVVDSVGKAAGPGSGTFVPIASTLLTGVSCPSASFCVALDGTTHPGNGGNRYIWNGSAWSAPAMIDSPCVLTGTCTLGGISCPNASFCVAVDSAGYALIYDGSTWSYSQIDNSGTALTGVSCPSTSFCVAVDGGSVFTYTVSSAPPCGFAITTPSPLPSATHGVAYSTTLTGCGGTPPYRFKKIGKLPRGLKLNHNGVISGTPKKAGNYSFGVKMSDKAKPKHSTATYFSIAVK
jgi:hypothetical protein